MTYIEKCFKDKGIRITGQRRVLAETLKEAGRAVTARELFMEAKAAWPDMNFSTVYRNIQILKDIGLACEIAGSDGNTLYAYRDDEEHHHHMICKGCGKTIPFEFCPIEELKGVFDDAGFVPTGHSFEVYGYCRECSKRRRK